MIIIDVTASIDGKTIKSSQIYKLSSLKYIFGRKHGSLKDDLIKRLRKVQTYAHKDKKKR